MDENMMESLRQHQLTSAQFEELMEAGWPYEGTGSARVLLEPATATKLRARMKRNRPPKPQSKQKVAGALRGKYHRENGEPLICTAEFEPIDGQNRLDACIETNIMMPTVIEWGWPHDCFDTINTGTKRSGGDMYAADGESNYNLLSAAVRYDWRITRKDMLSGNQIPEPLMRDYLHDNEGLRPAMSWGEKVKHLIPKGMAVALFYRFSEQNPALAKQFFTELSKGENINSREHTTWHLRELLLDRHLAHLNLDTEMQAHIAANVIKAWQGVKAGKVLERRQLLWQGTREKNPEPFPDIKA